MGKPDLSEFQEIADEIESRERQPCKVAAAAAELPPDDAVKALAAASDASIPLVAVEKWFKRRGHTVAWQGIRPHRKGDCTCSQ